MIKRTSTSRFWLAGFSLLALLVAVAVVSGGPPAQQPKAPENKPPRLRWYKGNTHTHTLNSDGDSTPDEVVRWYREHGYNFLVLTDHNFVTSVDGLNAHLQWSSSGE